MLIDLVSEAQTASFNMAQYLFPFDTQYVFIGQTSALLPVEVMDAIVLKPPSLDESYFLGNSEFDIVNITTNYRRFLEEGHTRFAIAISLATLFTLMILLGIVADAMPKGNEMSIIGIYILVMIILCAVGIVISTTLRLIMGHISSSKSRPPKWLR
uniref:Uncharacterized protein n=1 Tax=Acrobeloides nanus TaxID=290746 RepID=A0A914DJU9_9BILA